MRCDLENFKNKRILVVDDEPKNLKILRIRLQDNYELLEASSGEGALDVIESFQPALVLLDIMMEGIDGYEVARRIKTNPRTSSAKIILVSGKAMVAEKLEGYSSGVEDYITKPFNGEELKAKVAVFVKLFNFENELRVLNESLEKEVQERCDQLLAAERLAFVGLHTGEIVHNLKNPLTVIKGNLYRLEKEMPDSQPLQRIDRATDKILGYIKSILTSVRKDIKREMESFSLSDLIYEEIEFLKLDTDYKLNVQTKLKLESHQRVYALKSHISQVFGNLIRNAAEAMKSSPQKVLNIETEDIAQGIQIRFRDTGVGISGENLQRIFEPLFTTKDGSNGQPLGNGLGLPFCKKMIENYGGAISVQSELGKGTDIAITLPREEEGKRQKAA